MELIPVSIFCEFSNSTYCFYCDGELNSVVEEGTVEDVKIVGFITPVYANAISRVKNLGKKAELVKEYVEKFGIGIIIFDEIQFIDFEHTRENTFNALLTLSNRTKVAIAVVGTEDARNKMFRELRTSRRIGVMINGNLYCENKDYFKYLVKSLFRYQWFDTPVEATNELIDALYDVTKGIVDQLVAVYSCMHYDYLSKKKKPTVDANYVRIVAHKFYPGIQAVLANLESTKNTIELHNIREQAESKIEALLDTVKQEKEMQKIITTDTSMERIQLSNVVSIIRILYDEYSDAQIETAYNKIIRRTSARGKSEKEISRLVIEQLQRTPKRSNKKNKLDTPDMQHMRDFLGIQED